MIRDTFKVLMAATACAVMACGLAAPGAASADEHWTVDATFTDGGTVTGYFDINQYGYLGDFNLQTSANGPFGGFDFVPPTATNHYIGGGSTPGSSEATFFGPTDNGDQLVLYSENPLDSAGANVLLTTSFECTNSYSCPTSPEGDTRYLASPASLAAPEPAGWALMLVGVALVGAALRRRGARAMSSIA